MGIVELSSKSDKLHGKKGNYIFYNVKGYQYVRSHSIPRNPRSTAQQKNRSTFAAAVRSWQMLSPGEQAAYNSRARNERYSGYNLFISMSMKGLALPEKTQVNIIKLLAATFHDPCMIRINSVSIPYTAGNDQVCLQKPLFVLKIPVKPVYPAA